MTVNIIRNNRGLSIAVLVAVLVAVFIAINGVGRGDVHSQDRRPSGSQTKIDPSEEKELQEIQSTSFAMIPQEELVQASHTNTQLVSDPEQWWNYYRKFMPVTATLPGWDEFSSDKVISLTYSLFAGHGEYSNISPFSYQLIISTPLEDGDAVFQELAEQVGQSGLVRKVHVDDHAYIVVFDVDGMETLLPMIETHDDGTLVHNVTNRSKTEVEELFDSNKALPTFYWNMGKFFARMGEHVPDYYQGTLDTLLSSSTGLSEDSVWVGEFSGENNEWVGRFLSGGIDVERLDGHLFESTALNSITLLPLDEESPATISPDDDIVFETGQVDMGLSDMMDAVTFITQRDPVPAGGVMNIHDPNHDPDSMHQATLDDELAVIEFSPQQLQTVLRGFTPTTHIFSAKLRVYEDRQYLSFNFYSEEFMGEYWFDTPELTT